MTLRELYRQAVFGLFFRDEDQLVKRDCFRLLAFCLGEDEQRLRLDLDRLAPEELRARYKEVMERYQAHEPVAYITGEAYFFGLALEVGRGVLIPRPDSEVLVLRAFEILKEKSGQCVLEPCTGSACLSLALIQACREASVCPPTIVATEISEEALAYARRNLERHEATEQIHLLHCDLLPMEAGEGFDLLICNPPYIAEAERPCLDLSVLKYEPNQALFAEEEGLAFYRRLLEESPCLLKKGARLLVEHGWQQAKALAALVQTYPQFEAIGVHQDLAGRERVTEWRYRGQ